MDDAQRKRVEEYARKLGGFWITFNSLEMIVRTYLMKKHRQPEIGLGIQVGDTCDETYLTDYTTFGQLAAQFNNSVQNSETLNFDQVVKLRDALAHGRVFTLTEVPMTAVKFSRPNRNTGKVTLTFKEVLTDQYLTDAASELRRMIFHVHGLIAKLESHGSS